MTKRIVAILLTAAIAAATVTACGKTAESPETKAVTVEETETKTETVQETTVEETKYSSSYSKDSYSSSTEKVTCSMCNGT